jgi:hypothetical protein
MFLPGTPLGASHGIDSPTVTPLEQPRNEGDAAAGIGVELQKQPSMRQRSRSDELAPMLGAVSRTHGGDEGAAMNPIAFTKAHSESEALQEAKSRQRNSRDSLGQSAHSVKILPAGDDSAMQFESWDEEDEDMEMNTSTDSDSGCPSPNILCQTAEGSSTPSESGSSPTRESNDAVQRFRENHPRITRIGSFFFFRSASSSTQNAAYAPSGPSVFGAALDLSMPILFNFHLFIEAYNSSGTEGSAKILPLIFLTVLIVRSFIPPSKRGRFWATMKLTAMAPFHRVRFRDAFVGDVLTSLVRPLQDVFFALSYYTTVIWGTFSGTYGLTESGVILERSWLLHNVILPSCALLPLWWKFLQTLRQSYDTKKRWPHFGNSFKYLSAAMVILYGMTHPEDRRSSWWLVAFVLATAYQVCWDTLVDWELFVIAPRADGQTSDFETQCSISSLHPSSRILFALQIYVLQPIADGWRRLPSLQQIQLRPKRLYKTDSFYWRIFFINAAMRFTWMLCFIPAYHLSPTGEEKVTTFSSDVNSYVGVLLPIAELVRRTLWGFLLLEKETIKIMEMDIAYARIECDDADCEDGIENSKHDAPMFIPTWLNVQQRLQHEAATSTSRPKFSQLDQLSEFLSQHYLVIELSFWAAAFIGFGYFACR